MQGGLAKNRLSFREVFASRAAFLLFVLIAIRFYATVDCRQNSTTVCLKKRQISVFRRAYTRPYVALRTFVGIEPGYDFEI